MCQIVSFRPIPRPDTPCSSRSPKNRRGSFSAPSGLRGTGPCTEPYPELFLSQGGLESSMELASQRSMPSILETRSSRSGITPSLLQFSK